MPGDPRFTGTAVGGANIVHVKKVCILGSTGSIGVQALEVIAGDDTLQACGLACRGNGELLAAQAAAHAVVHTSMSSGGGSVAADPGFADLIDACAPDLVLNALVGAAGLEPTLAALGLGIDVALANKESLVVGGELVMAEALRRGAALLPVDSEHSALAQLLDGPDRRRVSAAVLTASGGPFRGRSGRELESVTVEDALRHPTWEMGAKITIDSATLMNKGLELIEAHHLFALDYEHLEVVVHPQSFVHAMLRLDDGSVLMHSGPPDMRVPIGHALRYPEPPPPRPAVDLAGRVLEFFAPDETAFPALALAREAGREGGTAPALLNAANEVAVEAFLDGRLTFVGISETVAYVLEQIAAEPAHDLATVIAADEAARVAARTRIEPAEAIR